MKFVMGKNGWIVRALMHSRQLSFHFSKENDLVLLSATLTSWEEGGRYGSGIRTSTDTVRRVHNIYNDILESYIELQKKNQE